MKFRIPKFSSAYATKTVAQNMRNMEKLWGKDGMQNAGAMMDMMKNATAFSQQNYTQSPFQQTKQSAHVYKGQFTAGSFSNADGARNYKLYIPTVYNGQALPLLVMLHGCTQNPDDFAAGTRMNDLAEEYGCLVLYPAQNAADNSRQCWNWFKPKHQATGAGEPAIIAGMVQQITRHYNCDVARVCVAGLSAGGAMAAIMAATYPDMFAAAGVHSGLPYKAARSLTAAFKTMADGGKPAYKKMRVSRFVPFIVFHGDKDSVVHFNNGDNIIMQKTAGLASLVMQQETGKIANGHIYTKTFYSDDSGKTLIEDWRIHGLDHAWSGGDKRGTYTDAKGPDASRTMLDFFFNTI